MKPRFPKGQPAPAPPDLASLRARLAEVEAQLTQCNTDLATATDDRIRAGILAHEAALSSRKTWYLSRIRRLKPVEALGVSVAEDISTAEGGV